MGIGSGKNVIFPEPGVLPQSGIWFLIAPLAWSLPS